MEDVSNDPISERSRRWAETMGGYEGSLDDLTVAHRNSSATVGHPVPDRGSKDTPLRQREEQLETLLVPGATRSSGAGHRAMEEEPDEFRTCFERDRHQILHSSAFRRLAGKTQVFIFP